MVLQPVDPARSQPDGIAGLLDGTGAREQFLEQDRDLEPGEVGTQAVVRPATGKRRAARRRTRSLKAYHPRFAGAARPAPD